MPKSLTGKIVANNQEKTVTVDVQHRFAHPLYKKIIQKNKRYQAHNEELELEVGDKVVIEETKPISKTKHFQVIKKVSEK